MKLNISLATAGQQLLFTLPVLRSFYPQIRKTYYQIRGWKDSDYFVLHDNQNLRKTAAAIFREDLRQDFQNIKIPTLIFWGEKDDNPLTNVKFAHLLHSQVKNSHLVIVPHAGHFSYLEDQEKFCESLKNFL